MIGHVGRRGHEGGSGIGAVGVETMAIVLVAVAVRAIDLGHPPFIDELNHILAARSLLDGGTLTIGEGVGYERGYLFTYLVAGMYAALGRSLEVARLPALVSGALLVGLLFAWVRAEAGRIAGWTAGLLLCFAPVSLYLSQWVRFYTMHALFFWLATWGVYRLVMRRDPVRRRWAIAALCLLAYAVAFHLQISTFVGLCGVGLFVVLLEAPPAVAALGSRTRRWTALAVVATVVVVLAAAAFATGLVDWLARRATRVDVWAIERARNLRFYHWLFMEQYDFLWVLLPGAALLALASRFRLALLFVCVFGVGIFVHSIAAWKAERYVFYLLPAWFGLWGLAAGEAVPWLWRRLAGAARQRLGSGLPNRAMAGLVGTALAAALLFAASGVTAYTTSRLIYVQGADWTPPAGHTGEWYRGHPDWEVAVPRLAPLVDSVDVVIGEPDMKVMHYLGEVDFVLYAGYLMTASADGSTEMRPEFTRWNKVGRPLVSSPASIESLVGCYESGLIVAERHVWGWSGGVPRPTAEYIESVARPVDLPAEAGVLAFRWGGERSEAGVEPARPVAPPASCDDIRRARREAPVTAAGRPAGT